jgi:hypothetical protein
VIKLPKKRYTPKQDVQLGKEAASEVRKQYPIIEVWVEVGQRAHAVEDDQFDAWETLAAATRRSAKLFECDCRLPQRPRICRISTPSTVSCWSEHVDQYRNDQSFGP